MSKLNVALLREVKRAFTPGDPASVAPADPAAAAAGGVPPAGLDPAMAGMMDPAAAAAGGAPAPAPAGDPAAAGGQSGSSSITLTLDDLIRIIEAGAKMGGGAKASKSPAAGGAAGAPAQGGGDPRIDQILGILQTAMGGAPAPAGAAPAPAGGAPAPMPQ